VRYLTLNLGHALLEDLLQDLGVLQLLLHLGDDGLGKLLLLARLDLALVTDPRVEDSLGLSGQSGLLLELVSLRLELGSLLCCALNQRLSSIPEVPAVLPWRQRRETW
jgi:hypothetical protein